jgi:hypothetical protein
VHHPTGHSRTAHRATVAVRASPIRVGSSRSANPENPGAPSKNHPQIRRAHHSAMRAATSGFLCLARDRLVPPVRRPCRTTLTRLAR